MQQGEWCIAMDEWIAECYGWIDGELVMNYSELE